MRTLEPWLREILRCPSCTGQLRDVAAELSRPELHCTVCRLAFRIDDGTPVLLIGEARSIDEGE